MNIYKHKPSGPEQIVGKVIVLNSVAVDSDWRFDNLLGSHLQSLSELYHFSWWHLTLVIDLIGQLSRDGIGRLSVKQLLAMKTRNVIGAVRSVFCTV